MIKEFSTYNGQSFSDVVINTYGSMDFYAQFLNDNNLSPTDIPASGQIVVWDTNEVVDQSIQRFISDNNVIFATNPSEEEFNNLLLPRIKMEDDNYILQENGRFILL